MTNNNMISWDNVFKNSEIFKKGKPFKHGFIEEVFDRKFYDRLYETFPKVDKTWMFDEGWRRSSKCKFFQLEDEKEPLKDPSLSKEWNEFKQYTNSKEFIDNFAQYSGLNLTKMIHSTFVVNVKGGFQLPHIDVDGKYKNKLQILMYFSKNWQKGDPGGTYLSTGDDESTIFFEPYNLDNSMVCFEETPKSWHGTRYIMKDVVRQALGIALD